jgi:hypothetical protein
VPENVALSVKVVPQACLTEDTPTASTELPPTDVTAWAFAEMSSAMEATPPELEANALAARSAAWSLVTVAVEVLSFLHENIPISSSRTIDSLKVFIF